MDHTVQYKWKVPGNLGDLVQMRMMGEEDIVRMDPRRESKWKADVDAGMRGG